jgi:hypothetical protein
MVEFEMKWTYRYACVGRTVSGNLIQTGFCPRFVYNRDLSDILDKEDADVVGEKDSQREDKSNAVCLLLPNTSLPVVVNP